MNKLNKIRKLSKKGAGVLRDEGLVSFGIKTLQKIQKVQASHTEKPLRKRKFTSLVDRNSVIKADWSSDIYTHKYKARKAPYTASWVMSPPSNGGGHQNIFRFIDFLDRQGYKNKVYLYSNFDTTTIEEARSNIQGYCSAQNLTFEYYKDDISIESDILFATGWETAYPVFNQKTDALKFYFVQDFEPLFYPMGTDYMLAENTYKFGFEGITAGGWLAEKLRSEYSMKTHHYDFGANKDLYHVVNTGERKDVFFYARPVTERRGFDLGIMALELFHEKFPEYTIHLAGWDVSEWNIPFPYVNHKSLPMDELKAVYNKCSAALVLSLTNMSLLPLELLSSGVIPVVNDGPNNRLVSDNPNIEYVDSSPSALCDGLARAVQSNGNSELAEKISDSVPASGWEDAGKRFVSILEKELKRAK